MPFTAEIDVTTHDDGGLPRVYEKGKAAIDGMNAAIAQMAQASQSAGGKISEEWRENEKAVKAYERTLEQLQLKAARDSARSQVQGIHGTEVYGPDATGFRADRAQRMVMAQARTARQEALEESHASVRQQMESQRQREANVAGSVRFAQIRQSLYSDLERRRMFAQRGVDLHDIAALGNGDPEKRLRTGSRFRAFKEDIAPAVNDGMGRFGQLAGQLTSQIDGLNGALTQIVTGGAIGAVAGGIGLLVNDFREKAAIQEASRIGVLDPQRAMREAAINFVADETIGDDELRPAITRMARRAGTTVPVAAAAASEAFSSQGNLSNIEALNVAEIAASVYPEDAGKASVLTGSIEDIGKLQKSKRLPFSPRAIAGFMMNLQSASRQSDLGMVGSQAVPAINSLVEYGDSFEQAAEMYSAMSNLMVDPHGRKTKTAITGLGDDLRKWNPSTEGKDEQGEFAIPQNQIDAFKAAQGPTARLESLHKSPELARSFMASHSYERQSNAFIEAMVYGRKNALDALNSARAKMGPIDRNQERLFDNKLLNLNIDQDALSADVASRTNLEQLQIGSPHSQRKAIARKTLEETMTNVGIPLHRRVSHRAAFELFAEKEHPEQGVAQLFVDLAREQDLSKDPEAPARAKYIRSQRQSLLNFVPKAPKDFADVQIVPHKAPITPRQIDIDKAFEALAPAQAGGAGEGNGDPMRDRFFRALKLNKEMKQPDRDAFMKRYDSLDANGRSREAGNLLEEAAKKARSGKEAPLIEMKREADAFKNLDRPQADNRNLEQQGDRQIALTEQLIRLNQEMLSALRDRGSTRNERPWQSPPQLEPPRSRLLSREYQPVG